jgi:two-component system phosphate regulon sensor histidine kinase PhoR
MSTCKDHWLLAAGVLIPTCACVIAWLADGWLGTGLPTPQASGSWAIRATMMAGALILAGGSLGLLLFRARADRRAMERHFDALCQFDVCDLSLDGGPEALPSLPTGNRWSEIADRVARTFEESRQRTRELKHTRTAWEIRCRRATAKCERIKSVLIGLTEPILVVDGFNELLFANPAAERLFQFDAEHADGRALGQLVRCQKLTDLLQGARQRKTTASRSDEIEIVDAQGQPHWYRVSTYKLQSAGDDGQERPSCGGAVAVLRDVGREKAIQKQHAEFVSSVSHEMKTPLAGIKAYVELLVDGEAEDDETREEFLGVISGQADRLQRLVENMLNLARIEAGVVSVNKKSRSLNELLEEGIHVVEPVAEAKRIELVVELSPMYLGVLADRDMLLQSAINLLSNAIKYTPEGGRVTLRSRLVDNEVTFEVVDTGVGLSEEDCRRVFDKFYRVKKDKTMASGTGLGLPLAKHIVEDVHGGRLTVQSTLGAGSTFCVTLPNAGQLA